MHFPVLFPDGAVGLAERGLMLHAVLFMLIVIVPVLGLLFFFAWRYREGSNAKYAPNWGSGRMEELVWWVIPFEIILILGALTWTSTHELDPKKPLPGDPLVIEVVALQGNWLFLYPKEHIATLNYVRFPAQRPIQFLLTADAPMNSFWIPSLGGQIYAMTGMTTTLHLEAEHPGSYQGRSANYSGPDFAQMQFVAEAVTADAFNEWVASIQWEPNELTSQEYEALKVPGRKEMSSYGWVGPTFFTDVLATYEGTENSHSH